MLEDVTLDLEKVVNSANFSGMLSELDLIILGQRVVQEFTTDLNSRRDWAKRNEEALKLALQVAERKTFPWDGASNVKFPLVTIASMQYHSRAYPALVDGPIPVACRLMVSAPKETPLPPQPPQGDQQATMQWQQQVQQLQQQAQKEQQTFRQAMMKAQRIEEHMSYQILEEDEQWEEEADKTLLIQALLGCCFKKTYFDPVRGINRSECVSPKDLVVNYFTKHLDTAQRYTHVIPMDHNQVHERQVTGVFNEFTIGSPEPKNMPLRELTDEADKRQGVENATFDSTVPYTLLEQYCWYDFDGDGYKEPYIVTVRYDTQQVLRIVPRFTSDRIHWNQSKKKIVRIEPIHVFTKYPFIPSPDGGFYDLGFGAVLGPINHSIDTLINQMIDAGSLACAGGGFLGRGFKGRKGEMRFRLGEWKTTDATGDDLRKSIFPLPAKEPAPVLFQLLNLLIEYGQQVAGATDALMGKNPGQNTPAETSRNTLEQGMKVFNGIYKRTHRAFTQELRKLYELNQIFLADKAAYFKQGEQTSHVVMRADYSDKSLVIRPAADPFYMSDSQRLQQMLVIKEDATMVPGYNQYEVRKRFLRALKVENPELLYPNPKGPNAVPPPINPKEKVEQLKLQGKQLDVQVKLKMKQMEIASEAEKVQAEIMKLRAEAIKAMAEAKGVDTGHQIAMLEAQIAAKKNHQDSLLKVLEIIQQGMDNEQDREHEIGMARMEKSSGDSGASSSS